MGKVGHWSGRGYAGRFDASPQKSRAGSHPPASLREALRAGLKICERCRLGARGLRDVESSCNLSGQIV
jgi:hypothetical protein